MYSSHPVMNVALIGAGMFGKSIALQSRSIPAIRVCAIADSHLEASIEAYALAGIGGDQIAICETVAEAGKAMASGRFAVAVDASILMEQDLDVVIEATGDPESGAFHALFAISHGKHVAMVNKETDAAVGPILKRLADQAGVVYTAVDGDQHGLLIGMVRWARGIGLDVLCGGKVLDADLVVDEASGFIDRWSDRLQLPERDRASFEPINGLCVSETVSARMRLLGEFAGANPWDIAEMTIVANATGLVPDIPQTHCPPLWATEIPMALCPKNIGGLLTGGNIVDAVQLIRTRRDLSLHGGVFLVVRTDTKLAQDVMIPHNTIGHPNRETAVLLRPHHLLGIEAVQSILAIGRHKTPTGAIDYLPRYDVVYRTKRMLPKDSVVGDDHSPDLTAEMIPGAPLSHDAPLPAGLARGNRLLRDVSAGTLITLADVHQPSSSVLWELRAQQDARYFADSTAYGRKIR